MKFEGPRTRIAAVVLGTVIFALSAACKCKQPEIDTDGMEPVSGPVEGGTLVTFSGDKLKGDVLVAFEKDGVEYLGRITTKKKNTLVVASPGVPEPGVADVTIYKCRDAKKEKKRKELYVGEFTYYEEGNDPDAYVPAANIIEANMGSATFSGPVLVEVGHVVDADHRDVVAVGLDQVIVFQGDGTGALDALPEIAIIGSPTDLAVADLNGDGTDDAAITLGDGRVLVFRNDRGAGLHPDRRDSYAVGTNPVAIEAVDVNRDTALDLVVANRDSGDLSILVNSGTGTFTLEATLRVPPPIPRGSSVSPSPMADVLAIAAGDFDGDGHPDVAVGTDLPGPGGAVTPAPRIELLLNTSSSGAFASTWRPTPIEIAEPIVALAASDFSHVGRTDLAVLNEERVVFVEPSGGTGTHTVGFDVPRPAVSFRVGDYFGTSESDVVVAIMHQPIHVLPAPMHGVSDGESIDLTGVATPVSIAAGVLAEADGTSAFDLVVAGGELAETIFVLVNDGSGFD